MYIKSISPFNILFVNIGTKIAVQNVPRINNLYQSNKKAETYQKIVATIIPAPMQSMKMTYKRKTKNCTKFNLRTIAKPMEVTETQTFNQYIKYI